MDAQRRLRILVLDEDEDVRKNVSKDLEERGVEATFVGKDELDDRVQITERHAHEAHEALELQTIRLRRLVDGSVRIHAACARVSSGEDLVSLAEVVASEARELAGAHQSFVRFDGPGPDGAPTVASSSSPEFRAARVSEESLSGALRVAILDRLGNPVGNVSLFGAAERHFVPYDETLLTELAQTASIALDNARLILEASVSSRTRERLLSVVSHDLKNPLSTIAMSASLLRDSAGMGDVPARRVLDLVERIERSLGKMDVVIERVLDPPSDTHLVGSRNRSPRGS
ncbi:MAG: histidine kinase dimerization/phospho-acceptor domain-containing protein [Polyangiaceae bacterium]